jgi:hypothetical protein
VGKGEVLMKKSIIIPLLVVVAASLIYGLKNQTNQNNEIVEKTLSQATSTEANEKTVTSVASTGEGSRNVQSQKTVNIPLNDEKAASLDQYSLIPKEHRLSLLSMVDYMDRYGSRQTNRENLIDELKQANLRPQNRRDENPYTGNLNIVRTQNTLPGTRYFHAQFFSNDDGSEFLQHLSFEFAPGEQSLDAVVTALSDGRDHLEMTQDKENFKSWRTDDGYVIWAKVLDASDFEGMDPFNAYKPSDAGIIRVAKEIDIHDHAPAFHAEQGSPDQTHEE